jgi:hypothetical protein
MFARVFLLAGLLTLILCLTPATEAQDKAKPGDKSDASVDADTLGEGEYFGKLVNTPGSDGKFNLRIDLSRYEAKDSAAASRVNSQLNADLQKARQLEQLVALNPTQQQVNALQQVYNQIRQTQSRQKDLYKVVPDSKDVEFYAAPDMAIRFLIPPVIYDDKGERKKFSLIDLREMRGVDPNVPGYEAKSSDLQPGQIVRVSLRPAKARPKKPSGEDGDKDKPKAAPKMEATMAVIVVAEDPTPVNTGSPDAPKKKKKK